MVAFQRNNQGARQILIEYRRTVLLRIALTNSIGFSASTAVPVWVASVGAHFGFASWGAGAVATGQLACAALLNAATPWLFRGMDLRRLAFAAAAIALLGNALAWLGSSAAFIVGCMLCGAGFGVLLNVTNRLVASSTAAQRGYAVVQLVEVLFCIVFYLAVPPIAERFGILSVFAVLAALCVGVFLLIAGVPVGTQVHIVNLERGGALPNRAAAVLSLCAAALLFAGYTSVSASLVSIGAAAGVSFLWVGRVMSLGLFASLAGAIFARGLGERAGVLLPLLAGTVALAVDVLVLTLGGGAAVFIASALLLFMAIVFLVPYVYALLAGLDKAGRWASIAPGFVLTGAALGPGIAGVVIRGVDFTTLGYTALGCLIAAITLFVCAQRLRLTTDRAGASGAMQHNSP